MRKANHIPRRQARASKLEHIARAFLPDLDPAPRKPAAPLAAWHARTWHAKPASASHKPA